MSVNKVEIYNKKYVLANKIIKEIKLLPKTLRERKVQKESISRKLKLLNAKSNLLYKELDKISNNIMSLEKEFSLILINNDKIKSLQKLILNSINLDDSFNYNDILQKDKKLRETIFTFLNFDGQFINELSFIFTHNKDLNNLLIGAYSYFKAIQNDYPEKYFQIKNKIKSELNEIKNQYKENPFDLILNYIDNTFKILENKEKVISLENEKEILNNKKNEIFLQIKLMEKQKSDIENTIVSVDSYINNITNIIDKHKLLNKYTKSEFNISKYNENANNNNYQIKNQNLNEEISENNSNIIYSKAKINDLNLTEKKNNNFNKKKKFINFDFKENDNTKEKKCNNSIDNAIKSCKKSEKMESINNSAKHNSLVKKINYQNIEELQKDIYDNYIELKNNPFYNSKNININIQVNRNIMLKQRNSISKIKDNNKNDRNKDFTNKRSNKNIYITKGISPSNTMITYGNIIINKSNEINTSDKSFNNISNNYKNLKSNRLTPKYNFRKSKESPKISPKKSPPCQKNTSIRLGNEQFTSSQTSQNSQIFGENKLKNNKSNNKSKIINKSPKKSPKKKSPEISSNRKISANISSTNFKNSVPLVVTNIDNLNFYTEQKTERNKQITYSNNKKKNFCIDIKHNKTNLFNKLNEIENNSNNNSNSNSKSNSNSNSKNVVKQNQKSYNQFKINLSDKELKKFKKGGENKSSDKSSLANLLYNSENKNIYNIKQKRKDINKININLEDEKENQEIKNNNNNNNQNNINYNNNKYIEINIKESKNKSVKNSSNSINIEYRIIPFKKYKIDRCNLNNILENKRNKNFQNNNKIEEKTNINVLNNNKLHLITCKTSKKFNNYSLYNNENRMQKYNIRKSKINK